LVAAESADPGDGAEDRQRTDILELPIGGPSLFLEGMEHLSREELIETVGVLTERYRAMAERLPAIVYIDDVDDISSNIYTSPQTLEILGISPSEWATDPGVWIDMLHSDDRERVIEEHRASNASGRDFVTEYRLIRPDGRLVWIRDHAILIRDAHGTPMYWQGVMHDVSELKQAQRELWETQAKYRAIVEDIPAIVYIDEIDDVMSTSFVSPQIEELLGIGADEYIADPDLWYEHLHPDDKERALDAAARAGSRSRSSTGSSRAMAASCGSATAPWSSATISACPGRSRA
jgi:PAS domain S-box-containing protein